METKDSKVEIEPRRFNILMIVLLTLMCITIFLIRKSDADNYSFRIKQKINDSIQIAQANEKRNQIMSSVKNQEKNVEHLTVEVHGYRNDVVKNTNAHEKSLQNYNELKKQNEKDYIPNATAEQQIDFISKYKYEPIETK